MVVGAGQPAHGCLWTQHGISGVTVFCKSSSVLRNLPAPNFKRANHVRFCMFGRRIPSQAVLRAKLVEGIHDAARRFNLNIGGKCVAMGSSSSDGRLSGNSIRDPSAARGDNTSSSKTTSSGSESDGGQDLSSEEAAAQNLWPKAGSRKAEVLGRRRVQTSRNARSGQGDEWPDRPPESQRFTILPRPLYLLSINVRPMSPSDSIVAGSHLSIRLQAAAHRESAARAQNALRAVELRDIAGSKSMVDKHAFALDCELAGSPTRWIPNERAQPEEALEMSGFDSMVNMCVQRGLANAIMLEDGNLSSGKTIDVARKLKAACEDLGISFLIEHRLEVATAASADGCLVHTLNDVGKARRFFENTFTPVTSMDTLDNSYEVEMGAASPHVICGRRVAEEHEAMAVLKERPDFVLVDLGRQFRGAVAEQDLVIELRSIRRRLSCHVVVSHSYCLACGGPNAIMNAGADGLQVPFQKLVKLLNKQTAEASISKELPDAGRLRGAVLLIAGGTVGAGIIALPVKTAAAGFLPTAATLALTWVFMNTTAALLVELSTWFGEKANLTSMASNTLGGAGSLLVISLYLFIYSATLTAYMAEGSAYLSGLLTSAFSRAVPSWAITAVFTAMLASVVFAGAEATDRVNGLCVLVALAGYVYLLAIGSGIMSGAALLRASWPKAVATLPIMVVAFTFHNIVPSLLTYLGSARRVLVATLVGSAIPLAMYIIWEAVILGSLPSGVQITSASMIVLEMAKVAGPSARVAVQVFSLFAIVTSFLGVALGCSDFLQDLLFSRRSLLSSTLTGLPRPLQPAARSLTALSVALVPTFLVAISCPSIFMSALEFSGTFRLILFGVLPVLMVWRGRFGLEKEPFVPGGRPVLLGVLALALGVIGVEWWGKLAPRLLSSAMVR